MRELFEICPKIQFFKPFWCFLSFEGSEFGRKRCKLVCTTIPQQCEEKFFKVLGNSEARWQP